MCMEKKSLTADRTTVCLWNLQVSQDTRASMDRAELFALTTRICRATRLPDVIALCDEAERLVVSTAAPTVAPVVSTQAPIVNTVLKTRLFQ